MGLVYVFGLYPMTVIWPDGFMWMPRQAEYEQMILATFAVFGVFLLLASRAPAEHRNLIGFAGWSSLVHGLVMLVQALRDPMERANLYGDIPALILVGIVLLVLNRGPAPRPVGQAWRPERVARPLLASGWVPRGAPFGSGPGTCCRSLKPSRPGIRMNTPRPGGARLVRALPR